MQRAEYRALQSHVGYCAEYKSGEPNIELYIRMLNIYIEHYIKTSECRALYSALQVYIQHNIQHPNVELNIRPCRSIFSIIFNIRMQSSIFGPPGLYSSLYSKSECRPLYLALQVYIQHYIQHPNVELYIRLSRSIFSTIFNVRMQSSTFDPPGLYSALYSTFECRALYSAAQVYIQHYIQHPNVELYIRPSRSIFSSILKNQMQSSMFSPPGLYTALDLKTDCRPLYSAPQVYIQNCIQHPNAELYIRLSRSILSTIFNIRLQSSIFGSPDLYSAQYPTCDCRALYSALYIYIQNYIQHPNVYLYIRPSRSIFSTIFKICMQSSIFGPPGLYSALYLTSG